MATELPQLCLGTAQLGMPYGVPYGINNARGELSAKEARRLLQTTVRNGVMAFDTSPDYGPSEKILGQNLPSTPPLTFISKVPTLDWQTSPAEILNQVESALMKTRQRLKIKTIPIYLFRCLADLVNQDQLVLKFLLQQKRKGLIETIGLSVYTPQEAATALNIKEVRAMQIPLNLIDKRFLANGFIKKAADKRITLLARSIFLQGLFFKQALPASLSAFQPWQDKIQRLSLKYNLRLNELALRYVLGVKGIAYVLIGAESAEQIAENVKAAQKGALDKKIMAAISQVGSAPENIINPSLWAVDPSKMIRRHHQTIELIFILGGHAVKDGRRWRSTRFNEGDRHGHLGDYLRPLAAATLARSHPQAKIVVLGTQKKGRWPGTNSVIEEELLSSGVSPKYILKWKNSPTTFDQLLNCQKFLQETPSAPSRIAILSNRYHLPRVKAMVKFLADLKYLNHWKMVNQLHFLSAEDILIKTSPQAWKKLVEENYRTAVLRERIQLEQRGTRQIKQGTYKFNS